MLTFIERVTAWKKTTLSNLKQRRFMVWDLVVGAGYFFL